MNCIIVILLTHWSLFIKTLLVHEMYPSPVPYHFISYNETLKIRGQSVETFIMESQDRTKNALQKSLEAAFGAWAEQLASDQIRFEQNKLLTLSLDQHFFPFPSPACISKMVMFRFDTCMHGCLGAPTNFPIVPTKVRTEKSHAKTRAKLIRQLEEWVWGVHEVGSSLLSPPAGWNFIV